MIAVSPLRTGGHRLKTYVGQMIFSNCASTTALSPEPSLETPLRALDGQHRGVNMVLGFDVRLCNWNEHLMK